MAEKRMIRRDIYESSVMTSLAEISPEMELEAQRIFETLILMADDYGRGRMLPTVIRAKAFASTANAITRVTIQNVRDWIAEIEKQGAILIYQHDGDDYYYMTGWEKYQDGKWYKKDSLLPEPPGTISEKPRKSIDETSELSLEKDLQVKLSKEKLREETNLSAKSADDTKNAPLSKGNGKPKPKGNTIPIEERKATTDNQRLVQQWYRHYLKYEGIRWSGDPAAMGGQARTLLKFHEYPTLIMAMGHLFDKPHEKYRPHEWNFYVRKISTLILEAQDAGCFPDPQLKLERTNHA